MRDIYYHSSMLTGDLVLIKYLFIHSLNCLRDGTKNVKCLIGEPDVEAVWVAFVSLLGKDDAHDGFFIALKVLQHPNWQTKDPNTGVGRPTCMEALPLGSPFESPLLGELIAMWGERSKLMFISLQSSHQLLPCSLASPLQWLLTSLHPVTWFAWSQLESFRFFCFSSCAMVSNILVQMVAIATGILIDPYR